MLILWILLIVIVTSLSFYFWPKDQRSLILVLTTGGIIGSLIGAGILISRAIPVTRKETVEKVVVLKYKKPPKIVYKDRIVYRAPGGEVAPVDVTAACQGKFPLQIVKMVQQNATQSPEDQAAGKPLDSTTWILARPIGSKVLITCGQPGAYADFWTVGDVVQIIKGIPQ